jgi:SAM-dependent methyltransferase
MYYRAVKTLPGASQLALMARRDIYRRFAHTIRPNSSTQILDFGVSEVITAESNPLEQFYPWRENITCLGTGTGVDICHYYPGVRYRSIVPGACLPFDDQSFDVAFSNAVLEHVGSDSDRRQIVLELARVSKRLFIAIPNRWFPIEHHTGIPILHFSPPLFRTALRNSRRSFWADPNNLSFISRGTLSSFWPVEIEARTAWAGIWLGPLSSNFVVWTPQRRDRHTPNSLDTLTRPLNRIEL